MPTAVLDLEFTQLPKEISGLDPYNSALALIRFRGHPVGKAWLPIVNGKFDGVNLCQVLMEAAGLPLWERWLKDYLEFDGIAAAKSNFEAATIAICTRDRPDELRRCLEALRTVSLNHKHEILVVDNRPKTNATRHLVGNFGGADYICEDKPGLNAARNRALLEAKHEIVAFMDDDAVPDPGWLDALLSNFDNPLVMCVTGLTMPLELETEAQGWFESHSPFGRGFIRITYDNENCSPMSAGQVGAGANMALRRKVMDYVGPFDEALDGGTPTLSGGDTEMFSRILGRGYSIVYEPSAVNWHHHRQTGSELRETLYGYGVGLYAFWTRSLIVEREYAVLGAALNWLFRHYLRGLLRKVLKPSEGIPFNLLLAELRGCAWGPWAYFLSRKRHPLKSERP